MIHKYNGTPYDYENYNCFDHVQKVRADAGKPVIRYSIPAKSGIINEIIANRRKFKRKLTPSNFDIVLFKDVYWHIGVYYNDLISHCSSANRQVILDPISTVQKKIRYYD